MENFATELERRKQLGETKQAMTSAIKPESFGSAGKFLRPAARPQANPIQERQQDQAR